jgi:pilus assembly protein Flp/PilA
MKFLKDFGQNESGATAIEYALVASLISLGIVTGASQVGLDLANVFNAVEAVFP